MQEDAETWRAVFDVAVRSMDFGSGFLDDEEVSLLRRAARLLGVDPMEATPSNFRCKYSGKHTGHCWPAGSAFVIATCADCVRPWDSQPWERTAGSV